MTLGGLKTREELAYANDASGDAAFQGDRQSGKIVKCIAILGSEKNVFFAHVVPYKGVDEDEFVCTFMTDDIAWLGHNRLKADNEPSLRDLPSISRASTSL